MCERKTNEALSVHIVVACMVTNVIIHSNWPTMHSGGSRAVLATSVVMLFITLVMIEYGQSLIPERSQIWWQ